MRCIVEPIVPKNTVVTIYGGTLTLAAVEKRRRYDIHRTNAKSIRSWGCMVFSNDHTVKSIEDITIQRYRAGVLAFEAGSYCSLPSANFAILLAKKRQPVFTCSEVLGKRMNQTF